METLESLKNSITSTEQMLSVVKTMKALAAINIREYERAVEALAFYTKTIEMGLQIALRDQAPVEVAEPLSGHRLGAIVFGSEQGLAGGFNERIAEYTLEQFKSFNDEWEHRRVMAIGRRITGHLLDGGLHVTEEIAVPSSIEGILTSGQNVLMKIEEWRRERGTERIVLFFNTPTSSASYQPRLRWLLPVSAHWLRNIQSRRWESRSLPIHRMDREDLFSALIRQLLFVFLYRAFAESMASENASRLRSMQSAERNIEDHIVELRTAYQHRRQSAITSELLDIAAGYEAISGGHF